MNAKKVIDLLRENVIDGIQDEVGKFWVVTTPSDDSILVDILFEANIGKLMIQARGGLDPDDILMVTKNKKRAEQYAGHLLTGEPRYNYLKGKRSDYLKIKGKE